MLHYASSQGVGFPGVWSWGVDKPVLTDRERALRVHAALAEVYPATRSLLRFANGFELLIAVILSAQTTDVQVNKVTPELFARYPTPRDLAAAKLDDLEQLLRPVGFFRSKARNARAAAGALLEGFGAKVPDSIEQLIGLPGVGRKTANVIVSQLYGKPGVVVDTHFMRVTQRLALTEHKDPHKIEREVRALLPESELSGFSMRLNYHGRYCCTARRPACAECPVMVLCPYPEKAL